MSEGCIGESPCQSQLKRDLLLLCLKDLKMLQSGILLFATKYMTPASHVIQIG